MGHTEAGSTLYPKSCLTIGGMRWMRLAHAAERGASSRERASRASAAFIEERRRALSLSS